MNQHEKEMAETMTAEEFDEWFYELCQETKQYRNDSMKLWGRTYELIQLQKYRHSLPNYKKEESVF